MTECLGEQTVVDLLEARLDASTVEDITDHLDSCRACRKLVADAARAFDLPSQPAETRLAEPVTRGSSVGRYVVLHVIGAGSMGTVYAAYDPDLDRRVALKLLRVGSPDRSQPVAELRARLLREAQALAQLSHPNVVQVYDVGTHRDEVFLAMELVLGGTLADWLRAEKRAPREILALFRQAGEGLAVAHAAGIVHRDFKPGNVILGSDGRARVGDFGLARAFREDQPSSGSPARTGLEPLNSAIATRTGALVGTPAYMAPEQWRGQPTDARTDVFAFSVALYEALYGERPFAGETPEDLSAAVSNDAVRMPSRASGSGAVLRALLRGLRSRPEERWASMGELLGEIRSPKSLLSPVVIALALLVAAALGVVAWRRPNPVCADAGAGWEGTFDVEEAAHVERAFVGPDGRLAHAAFETVERALSGYRSRWIAMRTEACLATSAEGRQSRALLDLRMRCLDDRRERVRAIVRAMRQAEGPDVVERAVAMASTLPPIDDCADVHALVDPVPIPTDAATRARIERLSAEAARLEPEIVRPEEAYAALGALVAEARQIAWPPLLARLLYDRAVRDSSLRMNRDAENDFHEAATTAIASRADTLAVEAWSGVVYTVGYEERRVDEALLWGLRAEAILARGGGGERAARLYGNMGAACSRDEERLEAGVAHLQRALELERKNEGADGVGVGRILQRIASTLAAMDRGEEADAYDQKALAIFERLLGPESGPSAVGYGQVGESLSRRGLVDLALVQLRHGQAAQERLGQHPTLALTRIAETMRRQGSFLEALEHDRRALDLAGAGDVLPSDDLSYAVMGVARDLLELGSPNDALPYAERAASLRADTLLRSERGEARFVLARALWGSGNRRRAGEVAEQARADYEPMARRYGRRFQAALDAIDTWRAGHGVSLP